MDSDVVYKYEDLSLSMQKLVDRAVSDIQVLYEGKTLGRLINAEILLSNTGVRENVISILSDIESWKRRFRKIGIINQRKEHIKIEIGSGKSPRKGYISCDIRDIEGVDHVCPADNLPFENNSIEEIYSRHFIEHFTLREFLEILVEWNRVLKKGGKVYIICPNMLWHMRQILNGRHESLYNKKRGENDIYWGMGSMFGWQQDKYDIHKFGYYFELLRDILIDFGFKNIKNYTNKNNSIENEPHHLEVSAYKSQNVTSCEHSKFYSLLNVTH